MISKLALGTVQFGLDYGINNILGQVSSDEIQRILSLSQSVGLGTLDTAYNYGTSEKNLGQFNLKDYKIVSKLPPCEYHQVRIIFEESLNRLRLNTLYGYLFHQFSTYTQDQKTMNELQALKAEGKVKKIGFSLYNPYELEQLLHDNVDFDLVQVPYNLFDQRFDDYFPILKARGVEIHTRSAFLQGLFFKTIKDIPDYFQVVLPNLRQLSNYNIDTGALCLNFAISNPNIDKVVIGVDSLEQLKINVASLKQLKAVQLIREELKKLRIDDENIINPSLWKI